MKGVIMRGSNGSDDGSAEGRRTSRPLFEPVPLSRRGLLALAASVAASLLAPGLTGCSQPSSKAADLERAYKDGDAGVIEFTDSGGHVTWLPKPVATCTPSGPYAQMILGTLAPEKLLGLSSSLSKTERSYLPAQLAGLPVLGRYYGKNADMNYEEVIKLSPDAIFDAGEHKKSIKEDMDGLQRQTGLPTAFVLATMDAFSTAYRTFGELLGVAERGEQLASYIDGVLSFADAHRDEIAGRHIRTLYSTGPYGYSVKALDSVHAQALARVGIENVADLKGSASTDVDAETVMMWKPDVLLLSAEDGFFGSVYGDKAWASIPAVLSRRVYEVPAEPYEWLDRPPSVQTVLGVEWLGNLLAPDVYDFDMVERAREFFSLFWGYDLAPADAQRIMANSTFLG